MTTQPPTPTHQAVQEYYGRVASETGKCCGNTVEGESNTCCGSGSSDNVIQNDLYPAELLTGLPSEIAGFSAGSGDPISLAKLKPGETVLDLGSGAGLDCFLAARQVGESGRVIGVDMTPEMLERARSNARQINASNVEFREGYLEALPVEPASVDVVISNCVINLAPDKSRVFQEIFRVLKPGGRIAVSDTVANQPIPEDAGKSKEWCSCASGALTKSAYQQELNQAGFTDILIQPNTQMLKTAIASGKIKTNREVTD